MKYWLFIIVVIIVLTGCQVSSQKSPIAQQGLMKLENWHWEQEGVVSLKGEWEFYWEKLYLSHFPQEYKTLQKTPSDWTTYSLKTGKKPEGLGYATYRLQVVLGANYENIALYLPPQGTAYKVYVNQKLIATNGKVSVKKQEMQAEARPQIAFFEVEKDTLEVVVQIANAHNFRGGMWNSLVLGLPNQIAHYHNKSIALEATTAGVLLLGTLYALGLFFFRRSDKASLYLGIAILFMLLRTISYGEVLILYAFPSIPFDWIERLAHLAMYVPSVAVLLFLHEILQKILSRYILIFFIILNSFLSIITLLSSPAFFTAFLPLVHLGLLLLITTYISALIVALRRKIWEALYILLGTVMAGSAVIYDILGAMFLVPIFNVAGVGIFFLIVGQIFALSLHIFKVETAKTDLEKTVTAITLLSSVGQNITANLYITEIAKAVYQSIQQLIPADSIDFGIYKPDTQSLYYPANLRQGKITVEKNEPLTNQNSLAVQCFMGKKEMIFEQYHEQVSEKYYDKNEENPEKSRLYVPLLYQHEAQGVLVIKKMEAEVYTFFHLELLKNAAIYVSIALQNAYAFQTIEQQKEAIEFVHENIKQSINDASRIQQALLPVAKEMNEHLKEFFVLFKPRDVVSGDFYYFKKINHQIIIAAADCTGHGVSGAFVSMLGIAFLNEIITENNHLSAAQILEELRTKVKNSLKQNTQDTTKDGMDIALCIINPETRTLQYAGAYNPLYYVREGELKVIKATKNPISIFIKEVPFENHHLSIKPTDTFYLFSDGYPDQFGGVNNRKFMPQNFRNLLQQITHKPMPEQQEILEKTLQNWKGLNPQTDDVLVIGFRC